jgi:hypothetical protein
MKQDIVIPEVRNVTVAVVRERDLLNKEEWKVYLLNKNDHPVENTLVSSKGYGEKNGETQRTSILRHFLQTVPGHDHVIIETIDPAVFHLTNECWVSYYIGQQIYDRRFVFVPDTICEANLRHIPELEKEGVLHS